MAHEPLTFTVGEVFPTATAAQKEQSARIVQFLLAVRPLAAIARAAAGIRGGSPTEAEDSMVAVLLELGAAKEAADAFFEAERHGDFAVAYSNGVLSKMPPGKAEAVTSAYERLKRECLKDKNSKSLLTAVVGPIRNYLGFHWHRGRIAEQLVALSVQKYALCEGGPMLSEWQFPFLTDLMERLRQDVMQDSGAELTERLARLCIDLNLVSAHVFAVGVHKAAGRL